MKDLQIEIDQDYYHPGDYIEGKVILRTDETVKMRKLTLHVLGAEETSVDPADEDIMTCHEYHLFFNFEKVIDNRNMLYPGEYIYPFKVQIPDDVTPSYYGRNSKVKYKVEANVDVPLWFDVKELERFFVIYKPEEIHTMAKPKTKATEHYHPPNELSGISEIELGNHKPKIGFKVELDKDSFMIGENIIGGVIINNPTNKKIRKINIKLEAIEYAVAEGFSDTVVVEKYKNWIDSEDFVGGTVANFSIHIPKNFKPTFKGQFSKCNWIMEFELDVAFAFDVKLRVPISIYKGII